MAYLKRAKTHFSRDQILFFNVSHTGLDDLYSLLIFYFSYEFLLICLLGFWLILKYLPTGCLYPFLEPQTSELKEPQDSFSPIPSLYHSTNEKTKTQVRQLVMVEESSRIQISRVLFIADQDMVPLCLRSMTLFPLLISESYVSQQVLHLQSPISYFRIKIEKENSQN